MRKFIFVLLGSMSLILGIIDLFLPLLPTTPLLLLSAYCYCRRSKTLYHKLLNNKYLGVYIKNDYVNKGITGKTKLFVLSMLWISIFISVYLFTDLPFIQIILLLIAFLVTIFIFKQKTIKDSR